MKKYDLPKLYTYNKFARSIQGYLELISVNNIVTISILLLLLSFIPITKNPDFTRKFSNGYEIDYSPCCSFPCQNGGICSEKGLTYTCDCSSNGYYGKNCDLESWKHFIRKKLMAMLKFVFSNRFVLSIINYFESVHSLVFHLYVPAVVGSVNVHLYPSNGETYLSLTPSYNSCVGGRLIPPVPINCPTPLGTKGHVILPSVDVLFEQLFLRKEFKENKLSLNALFAIYGRHIAQQFIHCNPVNWMSCSFIYKEQKRTFFGGKLKTHSIRGEDYPLVPREQLGWINRGDAANPEYITSSNTLTLALTTLWLREHNAIADKLLQYWPSWDDERLFQTARKIVTGEMLVITFTEWLNLLSNFGLKLKYQPQPLSAVITNEIPYEMHLAFHWPQMLPDELILATSRVNISNLMQALDPSQLHRNGLYSVIRSLSSTIAGQMETENMPEGLFGIMKILINAGRIGRLPSLNQYRMSLGLRRYSRFSQLTSNERVIERLMDLYLTIDGVELITGLFLETPKNGDALGETLNELISNWLFKSLISHPLGTPKFWNPSGLGGQAGWDIVTKSNLKELVCRNVAERDLCLRENLIGFKVKTAKTKGRNTRADAMREIPGHPNQHGVPIADFKVAQSRAAPIEQTKPLAAEQKSAKEVQTESKSKKYKRKPYFAT